jgi:hypothetical protein
VAVSDLLELELSEDDDYNSFNKNTIIYSVIVLARREGGGSSVGNPSMYILLGGFMGVVGDAMYYSLHWPGFNSHLASCARLSWGDVIQIAFEIGVSIISLYQPANAFKAFASGLLFGGLVPKIVAMNGPRYVIYDIDYNTGALIPTNPLAQ